MSKSSDALPPLRLLRGDAQPGPEQPVLSLVLARKRYDLEHCQHMQVEIDEQLAEAMCLDCGVRLNPIDLLARFAREESRWNRERVMKLELDKRLNAKRRAKCQHCGKMTPVHVDAPPGGWDAYAGHATASDAN